MKIESEGVAVAERRAVSWYLWCSAPAVTSAYVGGYWDISWHRSFGRGAGSVEGRVKVKAEYPLNRPLRPNLTLGRAKAIPSQIRAYM
jgi:hypothetical protein